MTTTAAPPEAPVDLYSRAQNLAWHAPDEHSRDLAHLVIDLATEVSRLRGLINAQNQGEQCPA